MRKASLVVLTAASVSLCAGRALASSNCLPDGTQSSGAQYRICMPDTGQWNGDVVLYAHGYVAFNAPPGIPEDQLNLPDGTSVPGIINGLGFAFATTGYNKNGLAVREGVDDVLDLVGIFSSTLGQPRHVYLVGPSEGGLVTALSIERHPEVYSGGLAACGPIGDFRSQVNYIGDFRVVFDYFFPGIIPGPPDAVPPDVITNWDAVYVPRIKAAIAADPSATAQLLRVTQAPIGDDPATVEKTVIDVLWYNVFGTNDAKAELGGQPYDNLDRLYRGSDNDLLLNLGARRVAAEAPALAAMQPYETTGALSRPLVTLHTLSHHSLRPRGPLLAEDVLHRLLPPPRQSPDLALRTLPVHGGGGGVRLLRSVVRGQRKRPADGDGGRPARCRRAAAVRRAGAPALPGAPLARGYSPMIFTSTLLGRRPSNSP